MRTIFADTFYFLALLNPSDQAHGKAVAFTSNNNFRIVTTEWVLTELADGLARSPRGRTEFLATLSDLQTDADATVIACDPALMSKGVQLYRQRPDKKWSLTDCISFVAMTGAGVTESLTGDHHFEEAGFVALLN